jgi:hypothetical protein
VDTSFYRDRLRAIRARNEVSLAIRRGASTLTTQSMRIEMAGLKAYRLQSDAARASLQAVVILGEHNMDIKVDDRLTHEGHLIKVVFIQLNRQFGTIAEGIIEQ